jgi:lactate racemase
LITIELPYGHTHLPITIPDAWLGEVVVPNPVAPNNDPEALIREAIQNPIGCRPLSELVKPGQKVAILADDYTRKTPVSQIIQFVLDELRLSGIPQTDICVVMALGTHRPMTQAELVAKLGKQVINEYQVVNIPSTDESQMVFMGTSSNGIPAWVNRYVANADVRIGIGMITPHMDAGFSGGAKIILPGVCSTRTVEAFHAASAFFVENQLGDENAILRCTLEQFVAEKVPLHFTINVILTLDNQIYQCVAGHSIQAHRVGIQHVRRVYSAPVQRRYPIVVSSSYPYDMDMWQSTKGVFGADLMTADGGTLIIVTPAEEGMSTYPFLPEYIGRDPEEIKREIETGVVKDAKQAATGVLYSMLRRRIRLVLCSPGITGGEAERMRMPYFTSVDQAIDEAVGLLPEADRAGSIGVLTHGGIVLPMVNSPAVPAGTTS